MDDGVEEEFTRSELLTGKVSEHKESNSPKIEGPIKIGNMNLFVLPIEHNRKSWEQNQDIVKQAINRFSIIIPEYFPPEYSVLEADLFMGSSIKHHDQDANYLFVEVASLCKDNKRDIWAIDPAFGKEYLVLKLGEIAGMLGVEGLGGILSLTYNFNKKITRRNLLAISGLGIMGMPLILRNYGNVVDTHQSSIGSDEDFRRTLIAKQLRHLSGRINGEVLLIYPPGHWNIIKGYLENEEEMQKRYNLYENLRKIPGGETFFQARHWIPTQTGWELKGKVALPT